jgi:hypothetical protein
VYRRGSQQGDCSQEPGPAEMRRFMGISFMVKGIPRKDIQKRPVEPG